MPKSKRVKLVTLSQTEKKGRPGKAKLIEQIRECVDEYQYLYVFVMHNMRTNMLKSVRNQFNSSRFFFGKNKVIQVALGRTEEEEYKENLRHVSECIVGNCTLFFTNDSEEEILKFFSSYKEADFARSGYIASETVKLDEGPVPAFPHSMESYLRTQLGLPTALKMGVVHLIKPYTVCTEGTPLTPEQAKLLKLLGKQMSEFYFELVCVWSQGKFKKFQISENQDSENKMNENDEKEEEEEEEDE